MLEKLKRYAFENISFKNKILLMFLPVLILFTAIFSGISNYIYIYYVTQQQYNDVVRENERIVRELEFRLSSYYDILWQLCVDKQLLEKLDEYQHSEKTFVSLMDDYKTLNTILQSGFSRFEHKRLIYIADSMLPADGEIIKVIESYPDQEILKKLKDGTIFNAAFLALVNKEYLFKAPSERLILSQLLRNSKGNLLAAVNVEIDPIIIEDIFKNVNIGSRGWILLKSNIGQEIYSINVENFKMPVKNDIIYSKQYELFDMNLSVGFSEEITDKMVKNQRFILYILFILFLTVSIGVTLVSSRIIVRRMKLFVKKMNSIKDIYNSNVSLPTIGGRDEIGIIDQKLDQMLQRLSENVKIQGMLETEKKQLEIEIMRAEFNPHFLYNSLSAIRWSVLEKGDKTSATAIDKLVHFYRSILSGGRRSIPLSRELEIIRSYVEIQKYTYDREYKLEIEVEKELGELYIPKFILQPFVENSILHGFCDMEEGGVIRISAQIKAQSLRIIIYDNGKGIEQDKVSELNGLNPVQCKEAYNNKTGGGYGIYNIIKRIQLSYGEQYGITFESIRGVGTRVTISLPIIINEENEEHGKVGGNNNC